MNLVNFNENRLPIKDLETIGLASGEQLLLNADDLKALLSGRRTGLLTLENLEADNIRIKSLNAKLSLQQGSDGQVNLLIHPVYRRAVVPECLDAEEAERLQKGKVGSLLKVTRDDRGKETQLLVEYDRETREYILSDTAKILAPDIVNGEFLTPAQKERYRKGEEVELADRTAFNYTAIDPQGLRANKIALIASVLIDGGLTYVLYRGLNALFNEQRDPDKESKLSAGYYHALNDMENQKDLNAGERVLFAERP